MHPRPPALQQTWIRAWFSVLTLLDLELARAPPFSASFICLLRALLVCVSACTRVCVCCNALHLFQLILKYADCSCRQYCSFIWVCSINPFVCISTSFCHLFYVDSGCMCVNLSSACIPLQMLQQWLTRTVTVQQEQSSAPSHCSLNISRFCCLSRSLLECNTWIKLAGPRQGGSGVNKAQLNESWGQSCGDGKTLWEKEI